MKERISAMFKILTTLSNNLKAVNLEQKEKAAISKKESEARRLQELQETLSKTL
jgi:hypothetical protein